MSTGPAHEIQGGILVIRPNRSLPVAGIFGLFAAFVGWALAVGIGFTLAGASMILPFAGLQALGVGLLCRWLYRHRDDCELITIETDRVSVMKRHGNDVTRCDFPRYWMTVRVDAAGRHGRGRLSVGSHGKFVTLGDEVNEDDRARLARDLRRLLRPAALA